MTKIDVFSGFLGAGKTTLIKKLIREAYAGEKLVLIENEFGEIGIDGGFMQDAGIEVTEMNSGCICCSLTGDFRAALRKVVDQFHPDRILIEPSGVGKLSDIVTAVEQVEGEDLEINALGTVVDAGKATRYMRNFGEFFNNQVESAGCDGMKEQKLADCVALLREKNPGAVIITTPWDELSGEQILSALEQRDTLTAALESIEREHEEEEEHEHHHHHHDHDEHDHDEHDHEHEHHHEHEHEHHHEHHYDENGVCECGHHHDDDDEDEEHEHHHHDHDHDHDDCGCGHHHHHHHGHDADEVFTSWGLETAKKYTEDGLREALEDLGDSFRYGTVLRAKGIVAAEDGPWFHFDYTPGEVGIRRGAAGVTGRLCVIGSQLKEANLAELFR